MDDGTALRGAKPMTDNGNKSTKLAEYFVWKRSQGLLGFRLQ